MNINKLSILPLVLLLSGVLTGCYYDAIPTPAAIDREVSFTGDIIPIFNKSCNSAGCHNAGGIKPDLSAANALAALSDDGYINIANPENSLLYETMTGAQTLMPPSGKLPETDRNLVLAWIEQGALNN